MAQQQNNTTKKHMRNKNKWDIDNKLIRGMIDMQRKYQKYHLIRTSRKFQRQTKLQNNGC
jgi:hypothetical protein